MRISLRTKVWILLALVSGVPLVGSALVGLPVLRDTLEERALQQITLKAQNVIREIEGKIDRAREDTLMLARLPQVRAALARDGAPRRSELEAAILAFARSKPVYDQVRVLDTTGRERARVNHSGGRWSTVAERDLQDKSDRYYFKAGQQLPDGAVYVSPLDWNMEYGRLELPLRATVRFVTGVFGQGPDRLGSAILNLDGGSLLAAVDPAGLPEATVRLDDETGRALAQRGPKGELEINAAALLGGVGTRPPEGEEAQRLVVEVPISSAAGPAWRVRIWVPQRAVLAPVSDFVQGVALALALILTLTVTGGSWIARQVTRPLEELTAASRKLSLGDFAIAPAVRTGDELEELSDALQRAARDLARQHELEDRLLGTEKAAAVGQLAAEIAHEVGNPLAAMKTTLQAMQEDAGADSRLERVVGEIDRLAAILRGVRQMAHSREPSPVACAPGKVAAEVAAVISARAAQRFVTLRTEVAAGCPRALADVQHLQQILFNLVMNAVDATGAGGFVRVSAEGTQDGVRFVVADSGPGIRREELDRIFEPFFTTKVEGSGLGLWVTSRLVRANGGRLSVESSQESGTRFTLEFPRA